MLKSTMHTWKNTAISALLALVLVGGLTGAARAQGPWTPLTRPAPAAIGMFLLLTDGRVMVQGASDNTWYALTPDATGSYVNGTWTTLAPMATKRLFFASAVLRDGNVLVMGGEYSNSKGGDVVNDDTNLSELYNTQTDTWKSVPVPTHPAAPRLVKPNGMFYSDLPVALEGKPWTKIGAAPSKTLPDGHVLLGDLLYDDTALYDYTTNTWTASRSVKNNARADEENWALLPDGSVLTVDCVDQIKGQPNPAERYIPSMDALSWFSAGTTADDLVEANSAELGAGVLLPNGIAFYAGATNHTGLYDFTTNTWVKGPNMVGNDPTLKLAQKDGTACVEVNGKVLVLAAPDSGATNDYPAGQHFLEYTYDTTPAHGSFVEIPAPPAGPDAMNPQYDPKNSAYVGRMLQLPNGQVLFGNCYNANCFVYTPASGPMMSWQPVVTKITDEMNGSFKVEGMQLNGLTEGAYYGDDVQCSTNYPLVRITDMSGTGKVYYGRTYNHSTMGLATSLTPVSTHFFPPDTLLAGTYALQVTANGIASAPVPFTEPLVLNHTTCCANGFNSSQR